MGAFGIWQWVIVLVIVLVLFGGRGKVSQLMGDFGKGLKSFKKGMKDEEAPPSSSSRESIDEKPAKPAEMAETAEDKEKS
jgi:sec-independent protein translocase protein TatA